MELLFHQEFYCGRIYRYDTQVYLVYSFSDHQKLLHTKTKNIYCIQVTRGIFF
jgi:hypothetical protein